MDLANLKNLDVKDLIDKLKSGGFGDKKLLIKLIISCSPFELIEKNKT